MSPLENDLTRVAFIGVGATATMDAWLFLLKQLGVATLNIAFIGRWVGHLGRGAWMHDSIAKARPVPGERTFGWLAHYATGIALAGILAAVYGTGWARNPSLLPALCIGIASVIAPLLVMQPAMGAGIASSKTPTPVRNCLRSLANHTVFGAGLYLNAVFLQWISP